MGLLLIVKRYIKPYTVISIQPGIRAMYLDAR